MGKPNQSTLAPHFLLFAPTSPHNTPFPPISPHFPPHFPPFFLVLGTLWVRCWVYYHPPRLGISEAYCCHLPHPLLPVPAPRHPVFPASPSVFVDPPPPSLCSHDPHVQGEDADLKCEEDEEAAGDCQEAIRDDLLQPACEVQKQAEELSLDQLRARNKMVMPYTDHLKLMKKSLEKQLQQLEEEGAYAVLGLSSDAPTEELKKVYKTKVLEAHPDKGGDVQEFQNLQQVYQLILKKRNAAEAQAVEAAAKCDSAGGGACDGTPTSIIESLDRLSAAAQAAAEHAAVQAQMSLQWSKTVAKIQTLSFPLGVPYFCSLVSMGAFRSAMEIQVCVVRVCRIGGAVRCGVV